MNQEAIVNSEFPRQASETEIELLRWLLPHSSLGYLPYREFITKAQIIGEGRWGEGDLIFDTKLSTIDRTLGMMPVVSYGEFETNQRAFSISIHDFNVDDQLEVQFSGVYPVSGSNIKMKWCYSYWKSGDKCPATDSEVREVVIQDNSESIIYVLAISPAKKVLWMHSVQTGFNQLIPITSFYDELLRVKHIRDATLISKPSTFFEQVENFTDDDFKKALLEYNKKANHKFDLSNMLQKSTAPKKSILQKIFGR
ncbi:MAG: hypothetical protein WCH46_04460 [bacterium]